MTDQPAKRAPRKAAAPPAEPAPPVPDGIPAVPVSVAWAAVMRDVEKITKDDFNQTPGASFKFRGIDATMNTVGPVLRRHGVIVVPHSVELIESERYDTKKGTTMHGVVTKQVWNVIGPMGDGFLMETLGQAADSGDKAVSKAASVAYRTALLQSLTVPTGDRDPDADSHDRTAAAPDARQEQWDRISALAKHGKQSTDAIRKHYREKMGHEIDGESTVATLTDYADRLEASFKAQAEKLAAEQGPPIADAGPDLTVAPFTPTTEARPDETSASPADEPADPGTPADPDPPAAAQGRRDPRQALWDDILISAAKAKMEPDAVRAHFREWALDATGRPVDIDGPDATPDLLTRYSHVIRNTAPSGGPT